MIDFSRSSVSSTWRLRSCARFAACRSCQYRRPRKPVPTTTVRSTAITSVSGRANHREDWRRVTDMGPSLPSLRCSRERLFSDADAEHCEYNENIAMVRVDETGTGTLTAQTTRKAQERHG